MTEYKPPKVWIWNQKEGVGAAKLNRPIAGATHDQQLPRGAHSLQLYSLATPNGQKVTIMLEELLEAGIREAEYDAFLINIGQGDQFGSGFVSLNPNSKIPVLLDTTLNQRVFESGHILLYLAEKFNHFLSKDPHERTETLNWLFWLQGAAPYLGGGFGHFYHYAPEKIEYAINRFTMEAKRQLDVLNTRLSKSEFLGGNEYSIADICTWPWYGNLALGRLYDSADFLQVDDYKNVMRWAKLIDGRPAVKRGRLVNRAWGDDDQKLEERHSSDDFHGKVMD